MPSQKPAQFPQPQQLLAIKTFFLKDEIATQQLAAQLAEGVCRERRQQIEQHLSLLAVQSHLSSSIDRRLGGLRFHLSGDLGAGKTTFVRALLRHLGYQGRVKSPTYTLCEPYELVCAEPLMPSSFPEIERTLQIYHFDLYRLSDMSEWEDAGFRDYLDSGAVCLVEWPERVQLALPDLRLMLSVQDAGRKLTIEAYTLPGQRLLMGL